MAITFAWRLNNKVAYLMDFNQLDVLPINADKNNIIRDAGKELTYEEVSKISEVIPSKFQAPSNGFNEYAKYFNSMKEVLVNEGITDIELLSASDYYDVQNADCAMLKGKKGDKGDTVVPVFIGKGSKLPSTSEPTVTVKKLNPEDCVQYGHNGENVYEISIGVPQGEMGNIDNINLGAYAKTTYVDDSIDSAIRSHITDKHVALDNSINEIKETIGNPSNTSTEGNDIYSKIRKNENAINAIKGESTFTVEQADTGKEYNAVSYDTSNSEKKTFKYSTDVKITSTSVNAKDGFYETSDERLKDFSWDIDVRACNIPTKYFTWKDDENKVRHIGTSAQEVMKVCPEIVSESDGKLNVDYAKLSVIAISEIKRLEKLIYDLEKRIENMENESLTERISEKELNDIKNSVKIKYL